MKKNIVLFTIILVLNIQLDAYCQFKKDNLNESFIKQQLKGEWEFTNADNAKIIYIFNDSLITEIYIIKNKVNRGKVIVDSTVDKEKYVISKDSFNKNGKTYSSIGGYLICLFDNDSNLYDSYDILGINSNSLVLMDMNRPSVIMGFKKRKNDQTKIKNQHNHL
jgi:hypothetical protein